MKNLQPFLSYCCVIKSTTDLDGERRKFIRRFLKCHMDYIKCRSPPSSTRRQKHYKVTRRSTEFGPGLWSLGGQSPSGIWNVTKWNHAVLGPLSTSVRDFLKLQFGFWRNSDKQWMDSVPCFCEVTQIKGADQSHRYLGQIKEPGVLM